MLQQVMSISLLAAMAAAPPAVSQGIGANMSVKGTTLVSGPPATKVLVATPYFSSAGDTTRAAAADSAAAVAIGEGMRQRLIHQLGSDWRVMTRNEMNNNLVTYGYGTDPILAVEQARALASAMSARMFVYTTMQKGADGHYTATTRIVGLPDDAGQVVKLTQATGEALPDFGSKVADLATTVFKAYPDGKACTEQQTTARPKAIDAANKAIKAVPSYGYAEYCLGEIAMAQDSSSPAAMEAFQAAEVGDPLSLRAVNMVAVIHARKNDTAAVVADYQQMLRIAPTNRELANAAFKVFSAYHRPDAATEVVNQQIALDPANPDWQDLKGNSCAAAAANDTNAVTAKPNFVCAFQAFSREYSLDQNKGDSLFFQKVIFVAPTAQDSLDWARRYATKFPGAITPLELESTMFVSANQNDSAVATVNRILQVDPTDTKPMLAVAYSLFAAHKDSAALLFVPIVQKSTDDSLRNTFAQIMVQFADSAAVRAQDSTKHTVADDSTMLQLGRAMIAVNPPDKQWTEFGHYFIVMGTMPEFQAFANRVRAAKNCDTVKAYSAFIDALDAHVTVLTSSSNTGLSGYGNQVEQNVIASERKAIPQFQAAFCK